MSNKEFQHKVGDKVVAKEGSVYGTAVRTILDVVEREDRYDSVKTTAVPGSTVIWFSPHELIPVTVPEPKSDTVLELIDKAIESREHKLYDLQYEVDKLKEARKVLVNG